MIREKKKRPQIKEPQKENKICKNKSNVPNYPIFCFKYLQKASIKNSTDADFLVNFLFRLQKLCELGWDEIRKTGKHSFGTELIPIIQIKPKKHPPIVTPEVTNLTVFRSAGDNRTFLGIQNKDVFHIIYI
jgi:hypothetical protein